MNQYILSLDQGTTSSRALLVDQHSQIQGIAQKEFRQIFPKSGWVEHSPKDIFSSQLAVIHEVLAHNNLTAQDLAGIGITNQRETTVVWDRKTGDAIYNAIVWQDRRTAKFCDELKKKGLENNIREKTGLLLDPYFSATKLKWILDNVDGAKEKAKRGELAFGTIDSFLVWKLTEGKQHITDVTNASRTMLFNIHTLKWDEELLEIFDIPPNILPKVEPSSKIYGYASEKLFSKKIPIGGIAGDQQAALFGQSCFSKGSGKITYGTGCFILLNTGDEIIIPKSRLLSTIAYQIDHEVQYAIEGSVFIAGAVVQWLRDSLKIIKKSSDVEKLAAQVKDSGGVFFVPAFTGLGAPHWNPYARGMIMGLSRDSSDAHIARAALEGIVYQVIDVMECMIEESDMDIKTLKVDGGASRTDMMMQLQTDLLGISLSRPKWLEVTALGAAYLAGIAVGFWSGKKEIEQLWQEGASFSPQMEQEEVNTRKSLWKAAINCAKKWGEETSFI